MRQKQLVCISTPHSVAAINGSRLWLPGSTLRLLMRSMGARFQPAERVVATVPSSKPRALARACDRLPPSGRTSTPRSISSARSAGVPSPSKAKLANSFATPRS